MEYRIKRCASPDMKYEHEYIVQRKRFGFWLTEWSYGNSGGVRIWGTPLNSENDAKAWLDKVISRRNHRDCIVSSRVA